MGQLEQLLPNDLKQRAITSGSELALPYVDALTAIHVAAEHHIVVLGLEAFELRQGSLLTVAQTGYDTESTSFSDWNSYARAMNVEAEKWIKANQFGANHGYIVTSATESELREAREWIQKTGKRSFLRSLAKRILG